MRVEERVGESANGRVGESYTAALLLAALIFCVYFFLSTRSTIWDRDEARFSRATAEMVASGNYLFPTFMGELRPDKPILIYWMMSLPVRAFGHAEWAYRLCAVLGTVLAGFFTYLIGRRLFGTVAGLWAMALVAANPLMAVTGAAATTDAVLLAEMTWMFWIFTRALCTAGVPPARILAGGTPAVQLTARLTLELACAIACGLLTKGPVALLPVVSFLISRLLLKRELGPARADLFKLGVATLIGGALFALWFIPANNATHGEFYRRAFGHHVLDRIQTPLEHHGGYSPKYLAFYFVVIAAAFFPWTFYLPVALARLWKNKTGSNGRIVKIFLSSWMLTILLVMLAISTKLPHYILPMWPALALAVGAALQQFGAAEESEHSSRWLVFGALLFGLTTLGLSAALGLGLTKISKTQPEWLEFAQASKLLCAVSGALILLVCLPLSARMRERQAAWNARILFGAALLALCFGGWLLLPQFETLKVSDKVAGVIRSAVPPGTPVLLAGFNEASLIFYLDGYPSADLLEEKAEVRAALTSDDETLAGKPGRVMAEALALWAKKNAPGVLVIPRRELGAYQALAALPELFPLRVVRGFNYSKGKWAELLILRRQK